MRIIGLVVLLVLLSCGGSTWAQYSDVYTSYGVEDGLPQSTVWSIIQDKRGFLWMGTADGIARFDGYTFTTYRNDSRSPLALDAGLYFKFYLDSSGHLWTISQNGIFYYDDRKDQFIGVVSHRPRLAYPGYNCFFGEDARYLWSGLCGRGLVRIDKKTLQATTLDRSGFEEERRFELWTTGLVAGGQLWVPGSNANCYIYNVSTGLMDSITTPCISKLVMYDDSEMLAGIPNGLGLINMRRHTFTLLPVVINKDRREYVSDIQLDLPYTVLVGNAYGLYYIDARTWQVTRHTESFAQGRRHSYTYVQTIFKDRSGNTWIDTNGDGVKKITASYKRFKFYSSLSEKGNFVKTVFVDRNLIYAGYFENGLDIFDRKSGFLRNESFHGKDASLNSVYAAVGVDSLHLMLNLINEQYVYLYSRKNGNVTPMSAVIAEVLPDFIKQGNNYPFFMRDGGSVFAAFSEYLVSFSIRDAAHIQPAIVAHVPGELLTAAFADGRHRLWLGTLKGAFFLSAGSPERIQLPEEVQVKTINEDLHGNIWLGTVHGIYVLDSNRKVMHHYAAGYDLVNQFIYGILRDDNGDMWFSHNKGITRYSDANKSFRHYAADDGLQSSEFNTGAYFKAADGELFFGGINGLNSFFPADIRDNPNRPSVVITSIKLFDQPLPADSAHWCVRRLELPYTQNSLSFEFAALDFTNPAKNQYAYMMANLDDKWINAGDKRFARYSAIPPGRYTFKVKASNNDGVWQDAPTTIEIVIVPPYWQQLWFRLLSVILVVGCITGGFAMLQRQRHRKRIRSLELQQKIQLERERISRDLHDTVGTQLSLISNNIEWVAHPLKAITDYERDEKLQFVSTIAKDIIATLRETIWALNKEEIPLEEFSDKLKAFVQKQFSIYPGITLAYNEQIDTGLILGPSEALNLFRICQEAIANSLKYASASRVNIEVSSRDGTYTISIADNGKGFEPGEVDPAVHNGLENMKYRAQDIGCAIAIKSKPGQGTMVTLQKN